MARADKRSGDRSAGAIGEVVTRALRRAAADLGAPGADFRLERPRDSSHGDLASNIALALASKLRRPPREIALALAAKLEGTAGVRAVEVAGPGFLNFRLEAAVVGGAVRTILRAGADYGRSDEGAGRRIMVEFVSANPTGPLHLGHGRQAALGDAIASLLEWSGWRVHREFYFNDAGAQIDRLAESVWARCRQRSGRDARIPEGGYHGEYVTDIAAAFLEERRGRRASPGEARLESESTEAPGEETGQARAGDPTSGDLDSLRDFAVRTLRDGQKRDLAAFRVRFDEFYPETRLYSDGRVAATIRALDETGLTRMEGGAKWLETTRYGDQKDRVMVKSDGSPTYFLPDVAYHMTKWERGFRHVVNVQGADHHSTVDRVRAGLQALGRPAGYPEYVLHQMVTVVRGGAEVRFSKRAGSYTTLAELVAEVGTDVARYFFLMRRPEAHLAFDLELALDQSDRNPVYKVQYAHARLCRIQLRAGRQFGDDPAFAADADPSLLRTPLEREVSNQLAEFPGFLRRAAAARAPHLVCDYLERTAGLVNSWYQAGHPLRDPRQRALVADDDLRAARLALVGAARIVLANGLALLGLDAPERMVRDGDSGDR